MATAPTIETPKEKFLRFCPGGFSDPVYLKHERNYNWAAHEAWNELLNQDEFDRLLSNEEYDEIARRAMRVEATTRMLLSRFEKSALHDAVKGKAAKLFSHGLFDLIYGSNDFNERFEEFVLDLGSLPDKQTSPLKWPIATIFPFIALPQDHIFLKPNVSKDAASRRKVSLNYKSHPNWMTYSSLLELTKVIRSEVADLNPRDMIDIQSYIWVTESWKRNPSASSDQ